MFLNLVVNKWKKLVTFFSWQDLKVFLLVTFNTFQRAVILLFKGFWGFLLFLYIFFFGGFKLFSYFPAFSDFQFALRVAGHFFCFLFLFIMFLAVRPSIERKDSLYFFNYLKRFFEFVGLTVIISMIYFSVKFVLSYFLFDKLFNKINFFVVNMLEYHLFVVPLLVLGWFFLFDTSGGLRNIYLSAVRVCRMLIYYFPIVFVLEFIYFGCLMLYKKGGYCIYKMVTTKSLILVSGDKLFTKFDYLHFDNIYNSIFIFLVSNLLILFFFSVVATFYLKFKYADYNQLLKE